MVPPARRLRNIYEINTATYLNRLSREHGRHITLAQIPDKELTRIASYGCDAVWFMGIWQRSMYGMNLALHDPRLRAEASQLLPDFTTRDVIGSAYSIRSYRVNDLFGGDDELAQLRHQLASHGLKLILDFVPNHTGFDHTWITANPEYYIHGRLRDMLRHRTWYRWRGTKRIACGRDPQFEPWSDVAQLNAFSRAYRHASIDTLRHIATMCDGVRCDMAMLMMNDTFSQTWGARAGGRPKTEYWHEIIGTLRRTSPHFIFIAECYWNTEQSLIAQGFDYCYDKDLYDTLIKGDIASTREHVAATAPFAGHLVHFLENHDEPRVASLLTSAHHRAAVKFIASLPGPCLWHHGQFEGNQVRTPVQLRRSPDEPINQDIAHMYRDALATRLRP
jgi:glycosidase